MQQCQWLHGSKMQVQACASTCRICFRFSLAVWLPPWRRLASRAAGSAAVDLQRGEGLVPSFRGTNVLLVQHQERQ